MVPFLVSRLGQIIAFLSCVVGGFNSSIAVLGTLLGVWFGRRGVIERYGLGVLSSFLPLWLCSPPVSGCGCQAFRCGWLGSVSPFLGVGVCGLGE